MIFQDESMTELRMKCKYLLLYVSHSKIQTLPMILERIGNLINEMSTTKYKDKNFKSRVEAQIKIIKDKIEPKRFDLPDLINRIVEKENVFVRGPSSMNSDLAFSSSPTVSSYESNDSSKNIRGLREYNSV